MDWGWIWLFADIQCVIMRGPQAVTWKLQSNASSTIQNRRPSTPVYHSGAFHCPISCSPHHGFPKLPPLRFNFTIQSHNTVLKVLGSGYWQVSALFMDWHEMAMLCYIWVAFHAKTYCPVCPCTMYKYHIHWAVHRIPKPIVINVGYVFVQEFCYTFPKHKISIILCLQKNSYIDLFWKTYSKTPEPHKSKQGFCIRCTAQCIYFSWLWWIRFFGESCHCMTC